MDVKYPYVTVKLTGVNGNAYSILGKVAKGLRKGGISEDEISSFRRKAMSGDYDNLLRTSMAWVNVI